MIRQGHFMLRSLHGFQCRGLIKLIPPGSKRRPQTITFLYLTLTSSVFIIRNHTCEITCTNKLDARIHSYSAETMHALTQSKQTSSKCSLHTQCFFGKHIYSYFSLGFRWRNSVRMQGSRKQRCHLPLVLTQPTKGTMLVR